MTSQDLAHLYLTNPDLVRRIEEVQAAARSTLAEDILSRLSNVEAYRIFSPCLQDDMRKLCEDLADDLTASHPLVKRFCALWGDARARHETTLLEIEDINTYLEKLL